MAPGIYESMVRVIVLVGWLSVIPCLFVWLFGRLSGCLFVWLFARVDVWLVVWLFVCLPFLFMWVCVWLMMSMFFVPLFSCSFGRGRCFAIFA